MTVAILQVVTRVMTLGKNDAIKLKATDVLMSLLHHDVSSLRTSLMRQVRHFGPQPVLRSWARRLAHCQWSHRNCTARLQPPVSRHMAWPRQQQHFDHSGHNTWVPGNTEPLICLALVQHVLSHNVILTLAPQRSPRSHSHCILILEMCQSLLACSAS